jgi:hypothetical protein
MKQYLRLDKSFNGSILFYRWAHQRQMFGAEEQKQVE